MDRWHTTSYEGWFCQCSRGGDVDVHATTELLVSVMLGSLFRRATGDQVDVDGVRDELDTVLESHRYAEA